MVAEVTAVAAVVSTEAVVGVVSTGEAGEVFMAAEAADPAALEDLVAASLLPGRQVPRHQGPWQVP